MSKVSENDQGFAEWLNRIDAVIGYDRRRQIPLLKWRGLFQSGYPGSAASQCCFSADEVQQALKDEAALGKHQLKFRRPRWRLRHHRHGIE